MSVPVRSDIANQRPWTQLTFRDWIHDRRLWVARLAGFPPVIGVVIGAYFGQADGLWFAGWVLVAMGWATRTWGAAYRTCYPNQLLTAGPYRFVRHPSYLGTTAMCFGTGLMCAHYALMWPCLLVVALVHVPTAEWETADLKKHYGSDLEAYWSTVPAWLPRLRWIPAREPALQPLTGIGWRFFLRHVLPGGVVLSSVLLLAIYRAIPRT